MSGRTETRAAISRLLDAGETPTAISVALKVGWATVYRVKNKKALGKDPCKRIRSSEGIQSLRRGFWGVLNAGSESLRRVAQEAGINRESILKVVIGASWKSRRRKKVPLISKAGRKKRVDRSRGLLNSLKSSGFPGRILFFSNEKNFVVDPAYKPQNDCWICFYEDESDDDDSSNLDSDATDDDLDG